MTSSSVIPLLIFDLIILFISGVFSLSSSSSSFSCSSPRFLAQPLVSLGESSEPRVFSLVSPIYSSLFLSGAGVFIWLFISTLGILSSFAVLLGLSGYLILSLPLVKVSEVFFILILRGILCWSAVTLDKISPCIDILERLKLFLLIYISLGFSILVISQINWLMK